MEPGCALRAEMWDEREVEGDIAQRQHETGIPQISASAMSAEESVEHGRHAAN